MPSDRRPIGRLAAAPLAVIFLLGCYDPPTAAGTARVTNQQVGVSESVSDSHETITHLPSGPDALRSQLADPLLRELLAGIENSDLRASLNSALEPLTQRVTQEHMGPFQQQVATARQLVAEAIINDALSADDAVALAVVQLALAGPSRKPVSESAPVQKPAMNRKQEEAP